MRVEIAVDIRAKLRKALRSAGRREIGHFRIVDLSIDNETGGRAHFVRSPEAHAAALDAFFERTGNEYDRFNYLGEWHSHPRFAVTPSLRDASSMIELVDGERGIDFAVLLIVRLHWWRTIASSCTLFRRSAQPSPVEILES
jgi:[CysO sulfur-carrier protein]-S-L-cysteine hydrolase